MDLKQYEHLAPEGATHLFHDTTWPVADVYAYDPSNKNEEAYLIESGNWYPYSAQSFERLSKRKTAIVYEIPPLNLENV